MASGLSSVWAIDIGNNSLKALHLYNRGDGIDVIGFANIGHGRVLSSGGVAEMEQDELIALTLRQFVSENNIGKDDIIVSVPSQNSFARFVKLPPVDEKKIPEIVKFEAAQQIPFDINDVQWDWQLMSKDGSSEVKVGIFAIKNEVVTSTLEHFSRENMPVGYVQMAPMALYNYILHDRPELCKSDNEAVVILNIGTNSTDLVVCTKSSVWQRCVPMGGNSFTKAISKTFKLNFRKAEKLKRTAAMSKYARQIFQSMRPVFTDMASEIQRSLGFYSNSNPSTKLTRVIAFGGGTKMRGLLKYLQQTLQIPIERPDTFKNLSMGTGVSTAKFHENVNDFAVVYGLGLQALGYGRIESNLLPRSVARSMVWAAKTKYFVAAALMLLLVAILGFARTALDKTAYDKFKNKRQKTSVIINNARQANNDNESQKSRETDYEAAIQLALKPFVYREIIPLLHQVIISALPNEKNNPAQRGLYKAFAVSDVDGVLSVPRKDRKQIFLTNLSVQFSDNIATAGFAFLERSKSSRRRKRRDVMDFEDYGMYEPGMGFGLDGMPFGQKEEEAAIPGFIVILAGYSPYKNIGELIDPEGVGDNKNKWGLITRLMHLEEMGIFDSNSPFELYEKGDIKHYKLEKGEVDLSLQTPVGVGVEEIKVLKKKDGFISKKSNWRVQEQVILIDPMTKEQISKVAKLNPDGTERINPKTNEIVYEANDHWFILNFKLVWKDAPEVADEDENN